MPSLIDPRIALAVSAHSQPGVLALLLGSGLSSAAGIPTGWGVLCELTARVALLTSGSDTEAIAARRDPDKWWADNISKTEPLTYSGLLEHLEPSRAARVALVTSFFEPTEDDIKNNRKQPTAAHRAIAAIVRRRTVRVIVTTNFDRLMERALEDVGIAPVVLSTRAEWAGAAPLTHSQCVVIKAHGDYRDLDQRNTAAELATYEPELQALLATVFDDYGLLIAGWSAESDQALREAITAAVSRRYTTYFASYRTLTPAAASLIANRGAIHLQGATADELFTGLEQDLVALDRLAEAPLSTAVKVERLKRDLLDPQRRIQVHDRINDEVTNVRDYLSSQPLNRFTGLSRPSLANAIDSELDRTAGIVLPLCKMLATGAYHDREHAHAALWLQTVSRLMDMRNQIVGASFTDWSDSLRHLPGLLALRTLGLSAVLAGDDELVLDLMLKPRWRSLGNDATELPAVGALYEWDIFGRDRELVNALPRLAGSPGRWPISKLLRALLREAFLDLEPDDERWNWLCDRYEYRQSLVALASVGKFFMAIGSNAADLAWLRTDGEFGRTENDFTTTADLSMWMSKLGIAQAELTDIRSDLNRELRASLGRGSR